MRMQNALLFASISIAWSTLLSQIIMSIRSFYASQDISMWMNTRILNPFVLRMHILMLVLASLVRTGHKRHGRWK